MRRLVSPILVIAVLVLGLLAIVGRSVGAQDATPAACATTTEEENEALVRRFFEEVWVQGNLAPVTELVADDFANHPPGLATYLPSAQVPSPGRDTLEASVREFHMDFPDLRIRIEDLVADEDTVVARTTWSGTQADAFEPWEAPDTGRRMERTTVVFWRVACGRIAEAWVLPDNLTMLRQLGVITDDELRTAGTPTVATPAP